jgi:hypothetical protein
MERTQCVICDHGTLSTLISYPNFPATALSTSQPPEADILIDFTIAACEQCGCAQLRHLVDPSVLYTDEYTVAGFSASWKDHHDVFAEFVKTNLSTPRILEIGGNAGALMVRLPGVEYSVLDMFRHKDMPAHVTFVQGNCETFDYTGHPTVVLSHVFEHLYRPREFVAAMNAGGVQDVFLAIPNFKTELDDSVIHVLNTQHTYYCDLEQIRYLFALQGYTMSAYHSHICSAAAQMIYFKYVGCPAIPLPVIHITDKIVALHANCADIVKDVKEDMFVSPAGMIGQMLWYRAKAHCGSIRGFIDNDINRHGKRLYGTDCTSYLPRSLTSSSEVFLCPCKYASEITNSLSAYTTIHIHGSPDAR